MIAHWSSVSNVGIRSVSVFETLEFLAALHEEDTMASTTFLKFRTYHQGAALIL